MHVLESIWIPSLTSGPRSHQKQFGECVEEDILEEGVLP